MKRVMALLGVPMILAFVLGLGGCGIGNPTGVQFEGEWSGFLGNVPVRGGIHAKTERELHQFDPLWSSDKEKLSYTCRSFAPEYRIVSISKEGGQYMVTDVACYYVVKRKRTNEDTGKKYLCRNYHATLGEPLEEPVYWLDLNYQITGSVVVNKSVAKREGHTLTIPASVNTNGRSMKYIYDEEKQILYASDPNIPYFREVIPLKKGNQTGENAYMNYMHDGLLANAEAYNQAVQDHLDKHIVYPGRESAPYFIKTENVSLINNDFFNTSEDSDKK